MTKKGKAGVKEGATPAPRERIGWRPGDKFDPAKVVGIMKVADLVKAGAKDNRREWSRRNLLALARSIERVGLRNFPCINPTTGRLVQGHMRVAAIWKILKWETCPVKYDDMDADSEQLARIQDNNRAAQGRWTEGIQGDLKAIEERDRESYVQFQMDDILEQLANQSAGEDDSGAKGSDRERSEGDGEGYVNVTFRVPASAGMAIKAKVEECIRAKGLVGKTARGQALEILVANGDPAHVCVTKAQLEKAVDDAVAAEKKRLGFSDEPR